MYRILLQNTPLDLQAIMKDAQAKNITDAIKMDETITSDKTGYAYFNDLFVKRLKNLVALFQEIEFDHHRRCTCDWNWRALF